MRGELAVLNVGAGDTKLVFDDDSPEENERSAKIVLDMIRRGFVLLIEVGRNDNGPIYQRARGFDPETREYIVAGMAEDAEEPSDEKQAGAPRKRAKGKAGRPARRAQRRVPAAAGRAVAVSRTAGG